jgi:transposase
MDLPDARSLSTDSLEFLRRVAVHAVVELNMSQKDVARILGVGSNAVGKWCAAYCEEGEDGLNVRPQGRPMGAGRSLTPSEEKILQAIILDATPEAYGIPLSTWTRRAVQALIGKRYDLDLSEQGVGNYLQRWKMTPQKPARHAREQDPDEVREFEEKTLPEVEKKAEQEDGQLHFADETGSRVQDQIGTSYAPIGQTPVLEVPKTRIQQNLISSVTPDGEMTYWLFSGTMNSRKFIEYLEQLIASTDKKVFLMIDRHPAHTANVVQEWVQEHADEIEITWLPRYSPEYNPDEFLNNDLKANLKNKPLPENTPAFADTIRKILDQIADLPERIKGYFRQAKLELRTIV